jgi:hypothetical protein
VTESLSSVIRVAEFLENIGREFPVGWALYAGRNVDALFNGEGAPLPSTVILDYVYSVAAYNSWRSKSGGVSRIMDEYREKHYADIPPFPRSPPTARDESGLSTAMDELNLVLMLLSGTMPEQVAERREKEIEQKERAAQEVSRSKVIEWRKHMDV